MQHSWYGPVANDVWQRAQQIKALFLDVDGVLTDGKIYLGETGQSFKTFHTKDGAGLKQLQQAGLHIAIFTGRSSKAVSLRMSELGITEVHQGVTEKWPLAQQVMQQWDLQAEQVAYMGDDLIDLPVMNRIGLAACPSDAHPLVQQAAHWQASFAGGQAVVRQLCDLILQAQAIAPQLETPSI